MNLRDVLRQNVGRQDLDSILDLEYDVDELDLLTIYQVETNLREKIKEPKLSNYSPLDAIVFFGKIIKELKKGELNEAAQFFYELRTAYLKHYDSFQELKSEEKVKNPKLEEALSIYQRHKFEFNQRSMGTIRSCYDFFEDLIYENSDEKRRRLGEPTERPERITSEINGPIDYAQHNIWGLIRNFQTLFNDIYESSLT